MRWMMGLSHFVLGFLVLNIGMSAVGIGQDETSQDNVLKKDVDLVSIYFTVRDNKKQL